MSEIRFRKIWVDSSEQYSEVLCYIKSESISVKTKFYVMNEKISELADTFDKFAKRNILECFWTNVIDNYNPDINIKGFYIDKPGHIRLEIFESFSYS
ncbi:MAG: hypothetical protein ACOC1O_06275 [bacterium]